MEYNKEFKVRLKEEIIADEGEVLEVYEDHLGFPTVGVGHLIRKTDEEFGLEVGHPITKTKSDEYLFYDLNTVLESCDRGFNNWEEYPDEVKLILANMAFNLGITGLMKFHNMIKEINNEDYKQASIEGLDSRWAKQVYNRAKRLMNRLRDIEI